LEEELKDDDYNDDGEVSMDQLKEALKRIGAPDLEPDLIDFLEWLAFRQSDSLQSINYPELLKALGEDYEFKKS